MAFANHDADAELGALRKTFYEEADERLLELEELLLELERAPTDSDLLNTIFRAVHSIKGGGAACELVHLATFAHAYESLLAPLRKGILPVTQRILDVLLFSTDVLAALLRASKVGSVDEEQGDVQRAIESIRVELSALPPAEQPSVPPAAQVDLSEGLVIWDDEPAAPPASPAPPSVRPARSIRPPPSLASLLAPRPSQSPPGIQPSHAPLTPSEWSLKAMIPHDTPSMHTPVAEAAPPDDGVLPSQPSPSVDEVDVPNAVFAALMEGAVGIASVSARICHDVMATTPLQPMPLREQLTELSAQAAELEAKLTALRGAGHSSQLVDGVAVQVGSELYVLSILQIESYFSPERQQVRQVPMRGEVLLTDSGLLPVLRLAELLDTPPPWTPIDLSVVVIVRLSGVRVALLVDHVLTQGKLLVKPLETNFRRIDGITGAAPFGTKLALVLDLEALAKRRPPTVRQSRFGTICSESECR